MCEFDRPVLRIGDGITGDGHRYGHGIAYGGISPLQAIRTRNPVDVHPAVPVTLITLTRRVYTRDS